MLRRQQWISIGLTVAALAITYGLGTTFLTMELERIVENTLTPHIQESSSIEAVGRAIFSGGVDRFMASNHVRLIGYGCMGIVLLLTIVGLVTERRGLASFGSLGFILSIYAYFVIHMSFLAGLGVLTALWQPFWGDLIHLGDIAYLPYMILVYPFSLFGLDIRRFVVGLFTNVGLVIFILGVLTWFYARMKKGVADFWIYRLSRHPQYLGWIVWSYGLMLRTSLRTDLVLQNSNPGASLPWVLSTLIILCVALSEEIQMHRKHDRAYEGYSREVPFMFFLPGFLSAWIAAPVRFLLKKDAPKNGRDVIVIFLIYLVLVMVLSLPFVLLDWPSGGSWMRWPF
jgi:protein-S-isoprenylcysteine O-methyltransferase Ste14